MKLPLGVRLAVLLSLVFFTIKLEVASWAGFADSEALYLAYARHPQPGYLDHPGLVGVVARLLIGDGAPSPGRVHIFASILAQLLPWFAGLAALGLGASRKGALVAVLALTALPAVNIGLFALSPHLLLAYAWVGALGLGGLALRSDPHSYPALLATIGAAACAAFACLATASGVVLALSLLVAFVVVGRRERYRTIAPYAALVVFAILLWPLFAWETTRGWPLLRHRLIDQAVDGFPWRAISSLTLGQLVYFTPPGVIIALLALRRLWQARAGSSQWLLWFTAVASLAVLSLVMLLSNHAEPHWLGPFYLTMALVVAVGVPFGRRLGLATLVTGAVITVLGWVWVRTPLPTMLLGEYAKYDLSTDLIAWQQARPLLQGALRRALKDTDSPVFVGPHYIVCAQIELIMAGDAAVGCATPTRDDYDDWLPRKRWQRAPTIIYVTDDRFDDNPAPSFSGHYRPRALYRAEVRRGEVVVRTIRITELARTVDVAARTAHDAAERPRSGLTAGPQPRALGSALRPALASSDRSSVASGFGVVSSFSP